MIRRKFYFVVALFTLMVLGFLATSLSSYYVASDSLSEQLSEQTLPLTSDNIYSEIQRDLLRPILISSVMASDTFLRDWVINGEQELERIQAYLAEIQQQYNTITASFISEKTRSYYHPTGILKTVTPEDPADAWYFRARSIREPYEINIDQDTADRSRYTIFINYRVFDYSGNYIGVTGVGLSLESVSELLNIYQQRYGRTIYFVDRQGGVTLTGNNSGEVQQQRLQDQPGLGAMATQILSNPSVSLNYRNPEGEEVYLNSRLVPEFNWYLIVEQRGNPASDRIENTLWVNVSVSLSIMALVLLGTYFTLRAYQSRLEEMATTDSLTGAANRHLFEPIFDYTAKSLERQSKSLSLVIIDLDHFKNVNDSFGHPGGDLVLKTVADIIRAQVRDSDSVCRWGGEEFMLMLADCGLAEAAERAESIRNAIKGQTIPYGRDVIHVTVSCGVAERHKGEPLTFLINRVDAVLYQAKEQGRDQVCLAQ